jgi:phenylpropionate dioxygenase-like ring-hydroxylating dioxygenase large terminal subunit
VFLRRAWYVAGVSTELGSIPLYRQIIGDHVALFRGKGGLACAVSAVCPHRGQNLALGTVVNGALRCPWHGWTFSGEGRCLAIPSPLSSKPIPEVARVVRYPVAEQHGLLWIWMDPDHDPVSPLHRIPLLDVPGSRREYEKPALARGGWMNHIENTLNGAHLPFVHTGSMGPNLPTLVGEEIVSFNDEMSGFQATQAPTAKATGAASELNIINAGPLKWLSRFVGIAPVKKRTSHFHLPGVTVVHQEFENGKTKSLLGAVTPATAELTWFFLGSVRTRGLNGLGDLLQRRFMKHLLAEDVGICETPLTNGPFGHPNPLSVGSDVKMLAFRKLYARALEAEKQPVPWRN